MDRVERHAAIYVAGGQTLIGSALLRHLASQGYSNVVGALPDEPNLCSAAAVDEFFRRTRPRYVIFAAGKSGGIQANRSFPADLMLDNLLSACHVIDAAHRYGAKKLLYLASSCSYPKLCPQPMAVESLWSGPLEPTNDAYATAKLAGITLCQAYAREHGDNFICGIPANAFGIEDDFSPEGGHVIPAPHRQAAPGESRIAALGDDLGNRDAAAGIHLRRRPGRRLPLRYEPIQRDAERRSTSAAGRICRSAKRPSGFATSSAIGAN